MPIIDKFKSGKCMSLMSDMFVEGGKKGIQNCTLQTKFKCRR